MALAAVFFVEVYHREAGTFRRGRRTPVESMSMAKMLAGDLAKVFGGAEAIRVTQDPNAAEFHATSVLARYGDVPTRFDPAA